MSKKCDCGQLGPLVNLEAQRYLTRKSSRVM